MENTEQQIPKEEASIFDDQDFTPLSYDKHVRQARNAIYVVAAVEFAFGVFTALRNSNDYGWIVLGVTVVISIIFFLLGLWTRKKPYTAILSALIFYLSLLVMDAILAPDQMLKGLLVKIFIIIYLGKGVGSAREAQRWKEALGR